MSSWNRSPEPGPARFRAAWLAFLALSLAACQPQPAASPATGFATLSGLDEADFRAAAGRGLPVYRLEPGASRVVCVVRREGPLARFGHDHAIGIRQMEGMLVWAPGSPQASRGELVLRVTDLEVDPPDLRAEQQLDTQPDAAAIAATRDNLLQHVLLAEPWPEIRMEVRLLGPSGPDQRLAVDLTLNGVTRRLEAEARIMVAGELLTATGSLVVKQTDWGITPFGVLGGGLRVADAVTVSYRLQARRWMPAES